MNQSTRRQFLGAAAAAGTLGFAGCQDATRPTGADGSAGSAEDGGQATPDLAPERAARPGAANWPQFHHDAENTGNHPESFAAKYALTQRWAYPTGARVRLYRKGELVFVVPLHGRLAAVDIETGEDRWRNREFTLSHEPVVANGRLYAVVGDRLFEMDPATGAIEWSLEGHGEPTMAGLTAQDGVVYWPSAYGRVVAFDARAREIAWRYDYGDRILGSVHPTASGVFVGGEDNRLHALDPSDGTRRWTFETEESIGIPRAPASRGDLVYVGNDSGWLHAVDIQSGRERWRDRAPGSVHSQPIVDEDRLYVGVRSFPSGRALAYDRRTGARLWEAEFEGSDWNSAEVMGSPAIGGDHLVVGADDGNVYGIRRASGEIDWTVETSNKVRAVVAADGSSDVIVGNFDGLTSRLDRDGNRVWHHESPGTAPQTAPVVGDGRVFVGAQDAKVHAVDEATGKRVWSVGTEVTPNSGLVVDVDADQVYLNVAKTGALAAGSGEVTWWDRPIANGPVAPVYHDGVVYFAESSPGITETLFARDVEGGEIRWTASTPSQLVGHPAVARDVLVAGSFGGVVYGFDVGDGSVRWEHETGGPVFSGTSIADEVAYVGSTDRRLYALGVDDGDKIWTVELDALTRATPAVSGNRLFLSTRGALRAFDRNGPEPLWSVPHGSDAGPVVADGVVYHGSFDGIVRSFDAEEGRELASFDTGDGPIRSAPAVVNGTVYVGGADGRLYALDAGVEEG